MTDERLEKIAVALDTTVEVIKNFDEKLVFNFNHQQGGNAGHITIHNAVDEILKAFNDLAQPYQERIQQLENEVILLRKAVNEKK